MAFCIGGLAGFIGNTSVGFVGFLVVKTPPPPTPQEKRGGGGGA